MDSAGMPHVLKPNPTGPRFLVLDIVRIVQHPTVVADGSAGRRGVVTGIRAYDDNSFRYEVSSTQETNSDDVAGIYDEDLLAPTDEQSSPVLFALPAGFHVRDVATVSIDCPDTDLAGRTVEITDGHLDDEDGTAVLSIWCEELGEAAELPVAFLTGTGERLPPRPLGERRQSAKVSGQGELLGTSSYVLIDDLDHHL